MSEQSPCSNYRRTYIVQTKEGNVFTDFRIKEDGKSCFFYWGDTEYRLNVDKDEVRILTGEIASYGTQLILRVECVTDESLEQELLLEDFPPTQMTQKEIREAVDLAQANWERLCSKYSDGEPMMCFTQCQDDAFREVRNRK